MTQEQEDLFFRKLKITNNFGITVYGGVFERENTRRFYSEGRRMFLALVENCHDHCSGCFYTPCEECGISDNIIIIESASGLAWSEVKKRYKECVG
jgi:hypothetical protein